MKAITYTQYGSPDVLEFQEVPVPQPKAGEVLIKVAAASMNDWDLGLVTGKPYIIRVVTGGLRKPQVPIPGVDVAGVVEAVGENVKRFEVGDAVFGDLSESGFGAFAEYVCADEKALINMPEGMSFEDAAALPHAGMLAWQGLMEKGGLKSGQKILINGAGGGVGTQGIQMARLYDVHVTGVDSAGKLDMLREMGFDEVIDYRQKDFTTDLNTYDLILDVKSNRSIAHYARALKPNGRYITVGGAMSRILQITLLGPWFAQFLKKRLEVLSLQPNKNLAEIRELYETGKLKPLIDRVYPLSEVPMALQRFAGAEHHGKIIIKM
ncbi:NAD(P)-dependent alcohol dehydrogenase [Flavilitoribacter nigricans]|uniref:Alcohol dehydrogenase n=1 Tax=Flavilitoribacter nigricans (strain ATCC 23147 / DSM 23189 / NBRC 102662 / NCIMB 1420 / SS-2) TaxID=1122177 RepID=A0A2D0NJM6_FLAN2|nr:NAD(P)-dependent alcohol dehydrogenase [Flavilitoribacter nigricans]PHN08638.1 alcohol dehydrogenase [Flavilitoribacter nigricans DSM 23189 = NBRC 102662]